MNWAQLFIDYQTYRDYDYVVSIDRARLFIVAARGLRGAPDRFSVFGDEIAAPAKASLEADIEAAERWIASQTDAVGSGLRPGVCYVNFEGYRQ